MGFSFINTFNPVGKYKQILDDVLTPHPDGDVKQIDLCCGLGFGKTLLAIQAAAWTMEQCDESRILFLEPDWDRVRDTFLQRWMDIIPPEKYTHQPGRNRIVWDNGAYLIYRPRVITGSKERARGKFRSIEFSAVIDDETAIGFDLEQYQNTLARIRVNASLRYYLTLSTPLIGPYGRFIKRGGNTLYRGRTRDNVYLHRIDPLYEERQRKSMSREQARRELDGELVALEGRIWKDVKCDFADPDHAWPRGNVDDEHPQFDPNEPFWLFCDLGGATGAYVVAQRRHATRRGRRLFEGDVWVLVADLCPINDAEAARAFEIINQNFGRPAGVVAGADSNSRDKISGMTMAMFVQQIWGNVPIYPCREDNLTKQRAYNGMNYLINCNEDRRLTIARNFISLEEDSKRGVREMFDEDAWPPIDRQRDSDFLPKNKEILVQHVRDALLMGTYTVMKPPEWRQTEYRVR